MITKTIPINTRISKAVRWKGAYPFDFDENSIETETTYQNYIKGVGGGGSCCTTTRIGRKRIIQKNKTIGTTVRDTRKKVNHLSKVVLEQKIIANFTTLMSFIRIDLTVLMMDFKVSKDKLIRGVDQSNEIYIKWNSIKIHAWRKGWWSIGKKKWDTEWSKASRNCK